MIKQYETPVEKRSSVLKAAPKSLNEKDRTLEAVISTNQVDRDGEIVEPSAFKERLDNFRKNPVFLWMHNPEKPIGKVAEVEVKSDSLEALLQFREEGVSELSDDIFSLYKDGTLSTFSIGFRVFKMEFSQDDEGKSEPPRIVDAELYEASAVSIPANPGAVAKMHRYVSPPKLTVSPDTAAAVSKELGEEQTLSKALEISNQLIERRLLGEAVPASLWAQVSKMRIALLGLGEHNKSEDEDALRLLADASEHMRSLFSEMTIRSDEE